MKRWALVFSVMACVSCSTGPAPLEEYTLARAAIESAKVVESARLAPDYWHQAEDAYNHAQKLYNDRDFAKAKKEFIRSKFAAEKAETASRLARQKNGEVL